MRGFLGDLRVVLYMFTKIGLVRSFKETFGQIMIIIVFSH